MTYQVMIIDMLPIHCRFQLLLPTALLPPEDSVVTLVTQAYHLLQRVNRYKEAGQHHTASGRPKSGDMLLVALDCEHSQQKLLRHLMVKIS
jgi:hypothetical protein